jgi:uncharacterized protein YdeI (YjbR/CyaY-like superfamily)
MQQGNPQVDAYIAVAPSFARPILEHLRALVHQACPPVEESIKWGHVHFSHHGLLCSMAAFKPHCAFGFWKHRQIFGDDFPAFEAAMGRFGRITALAELPDDTQLLARIERAVAGSESGTRAPPRPRPAPKPPAIVPDDLATALAGNTEAGKRFDAFSPSHRREYIEWIEEAKTTVTRAKRLAQNVEWIAEGKPRHWKYAHAR